MTQKVGISSRRSVRPAVRFRRWIYLLAACLVLAIPLVGLAAVLEEPPTFVAKWGRSVLETGNSSVPTA